jgi:hypothetical protein
MAPRTSTKKDDSPEIQLDAFLDRFTPQVAAIGRTCLAKMQERLPGAVRLVYDNYNALVIGFGPSERASEAIFSIALYPRWVTLFFLQGAGLADPKRLLKGSGKIVRHIVLASATDLNLPAIQDLIAKALKRSEFGIDPTASGRMVIRSISSKQRPRRPK